MVHKEREYFGVPADPERQRSAQLEAEVAAALGTRGKLDATDVVVTVTPDSGIILSGWAMDEAELRTCLEPARSIPGVLYVESSIALRNSSPARHGHLQRLPLG